MSGCVGYDDGEGDRETTPSTKLLLLVAPLILVSLFVAALGPAKVFQWDYKSPWWAGGAGWSSPQDVEAPPAEQSLGLVRKDSDVNQSVASPPPSENPGGFSIKNATADSKKELTVLERLEAGLQAARLAIRKAKSEDQAQEVDPDYVPSGPMYWNPRTFHRSYLEMEKQFKIYIYKEGEPPLCHDGPIKGIYSIEGNVISQLEMDGRFQTNDPEKAHVFLLPFSVTSIVVFVFEGATHDWHPMKRIVMDYVKVVSQKYPYWNRSLGADHLMVACHDWGPELSFSVPNLYNNSIRALCNANTSERFIPSKDVTLPEILSETGSLEGLVGGPPPSKRDILAFFSGGPDHGPIRPVLLEHWEDKDPDIRAHRYLPKNMSYYDLLRRSKFCLCPSGYEVASPRVVESLYTGCVPVLISSGYVAPFSDVLNWETFAVILAPEDIPNLKRVLTSISSKQYLKMHKRGLQMRRHFMANFPPKRYDVYHMILHSIWLRRLNVRVYDEGPRDI
uniref:Exostosin GT47 domain-containing protein n=1 Tax=Kalanchoe fedtschenkoi TaxID=63787 RepID=A0A7N0UB51_KALFE